MTSPTASVDRDSASYRVYDFGARGFGIVTADAGAGIRLEPSLAGRETQNEVRQERAAIDPSIGVTLVS